MSIFEKIKALFPEEHIFKAPVSFDEDFVLINEKREYDDVDVYHIDIIVSIPDHIQEIREWISEAGYDPNEVDIAEIDLTQFLASVLPDILFDGVKIYTEEFPFNDLSSLVYDYIVDGGYNVTLSLVIVTDGNETMIIPVYDDDEAVDILKKIYLAVNVNEVDFQTWQTVFSLAYAKKK